MLMRDVLEGMEDFSLHACYESNDFDMEILSISKENRKTRQRLSKDFAGQKTVSRSAEIIYPKRFKKATG